MTTGITVHLCRTDAAEIKNLNTKETSKGKEQNRCMINGLGRQFNLAVDSIQGSEEKPHLSLLERKGVWHKGRKAIIQVVDDQTNRTVFLKVNLESFRKRFGLSDKQITQALKEHPDRDLTSLFEQHTQYERGLKLLEHGQLKAAKACFIKAGDLPKAQRQLCLLRADFHEIKAEITKTKHMQNKSPEDTKYLISLLKAATLLEDNGRSVADLEALARKGNGDANYALATIHEQTDKVGSLEKAYKFYARAVLAGEPNALYIVAMEINKHPELRSIVERITKVDPEAWLKKASNSGHEEASLELALRYEKAGNDQEMIKYFKKAADAGSAYAQNRLGIYYLLGQKGIKSNPKMAENYLIQVANSLPPNSRGMMSLALLYQYGREEVAKDEQKAKVWFDKFEEIANVGDLVLLSDFYSQGIEGFKVKDNEQAEIWFKKAAQKRDEIDNMGGTNYCIEKALNAETDSKAATWMKLAVEIFTDKGKTSATAINALGILYLEGSRGLDASTEKAEECFIEAANRKPPSFEAMINLALLHRKKEQGVAEVDWLMLAERQGDTKNWLRASEFCQTNYPILGLPNLELAQEFFKKGVQKAQTSKKKEDAQSLVEFGLKQNDASSFRAFETAAEIDPNSMKAKLNLAYCYLHGKGVNANPQKANELYVEILKKDPHNHLAKINLYLLSKIGKEDYLPNPDQAEKLAALIKVEVPKETIIRLGDFLAKGSKGWFTPMVNEARDWYLVADSKFGLLETWQNDAESEMQKNLHKKIEELPNL